MTNLAYKVAFYYKTLTPSNIIMQSKFTNLFPFKVNSIKPLLKQQIVGLRHKYMVIANTYDLSIRINQINVIIINRVCSCHCRLALAD